MAEGEWSACLIFVLIGVVMRFLSQVAVAALEPLVPDGAELKVQVYGAEGKPLGASVTTLPPEKLQEPPESLRTSLSESQKPKVTLEFFHR